MLGLTSYQETLRALGAMLEPASRVSIVEQPGSACIQVRTPRANYNVGSAELQEMVLRSHARRGERTPASPLADILRSVGRALDELHALDICLELTSERLSVGFLDQHRRPHELRYADEELEALRKTAAARRNGQPLSRVLILQASSAAVAPVVELLVAEFAVQALPAMYARAIASSLQTPDLILAQANGPEVLEAVRLLRSSPRLDQIPILLLASAGVGLDPEPAFTAGADDLLQEPVLPAQLRARVRTSLLRRR